MRGSQREISAWGPGEFLGRAILERPMRPTLVVFLPPGLADKASALFFLDTYRRH